MQGLAYDSNVGREFAARVLGTMRNAAYETSVQLAEEKGCFPLFEADAYLDRPFTHRLPEKLGAAIREKGIRNSHLLAIAPTGSISLLAGNVSAGIEPVFAASVSRRVRRLHGGYDMLDMEDYACRLWRKGAGEGLPPAFVTAGQLPPEAHLAMQATAQGFVDNAISKTINADAGLPYQAFADVYRNAYDQGLKGCTVYRQGSRGEDVLTPRPEGGRCPSDTC
jgi:ribonucleoside-diphosphate reductase alpha chain